jgi:nucleoside 2-deoxyribosyltransferase
MFTVFLSHSVADREQADRVMRGLADAGLEVVDPRAIVTGASWKDDVWDALTKSDALVVLADARREPSADVAVELGAAMAWHKPIFVVRTDGDPAAPLPAAYFAGLPTFPSSRLADVVSSIRLQAAPLSEADRTNLRVAYAELAVPSDQYLTNPELVDELATRFTARSAKRVAGERLVQELMRMQKSGTLPKLHKRR